MPFLNSMGPRPGSQYAQMIRERFNTTHRPVTRPRESAPFVAVPDSLDVAKVSGESEELRLGVAHEAMPPSSCLARQASHASAIGSWPSSSMALMRSTSSISPLVEVHVVFDEEPGSPSIGRGDRCDDAYPVIEGPSLTDVLRY